MEEKPEFPKSDVVPPNGFEVVLVDPKSPPLLVLVPKLPKEVGLFALKALLGCEKRPPVVPVPELPNRLFDVPLTAPKPKPVLVEEVAGWLNVLDPKSPPGLFCVEPNSPPVLVVVPNADVAKPPVVPNPVFCCPKVDEEPKPLDPPPKGVPKELLNILLC